MYRVLIADDEDIICRGLAGMVSQHPRLQVVALAEDGEIAVERAKETQPDLMLVDINMPFLNGFELVEAVRKVLPDVTIIIITGYDDFEFVQKALHLGVADYVLKPVMEEAFFAVLDRVVSRMDGMDSSRKLMNWMEGQMEKNRPAMIDDFFHDWIDGQLSESLVENQMRYLKIQIPVPYRIIFIQLLGENGREILRSSGTSLQIECGKIVCEVLEPYSEAIYFRTEEGMPVILSAVFPEQLVHKMKQLFEERLHISADPVWKQGNSITEFPEVFRQEMELYIGRKQYSAVVLRAISMVNTQWGDSELSLQSVADSLYVSSSYLSRLFRNETGDNFAAYLTKKRIEEAIRLLKDTDMKMYEIAQKTGYTSQHYFSSAFKKVLGISPADYRKNTFGQGDTQ